jgi:hypothetical protein
MWVLRFTFIFVIPTQGRPEVREFAPPPLLMGPRPTVFLYRTFIII